MERNFEPKETVRKSSLTMPRWWTAEHTSAWERTKHAMKRDWEQTKAHFSKQSGAELNQKATDTVKQAAGKEPIPPGNLPNPPEARHEKAEWKDVEPAYRYGCGARMYYGKTHERWTPELEEKLRGEWKDMRGEDWDRNREHVRRGYESEEQKH